MELINYRLILMVVSFLFTGVTRDCVDESSSIGFINPVVKPFGIFGEIATGSMSPLISAIKKSPSWFEKGEINTNKKNNKKNNKNTKQIETEEEETALVENTTKSDEEVKVQTEVPQEEEEEQEEVVPAQEEPGVVVEANPAIGALNAEEPELAISEADKQEYIDAIEELEKEVEALSPNNLTGKFRKPATAALTKIEKLAIFKTTPKAMASINNIKRHLKKMQPPTGKDNEDLKTQMLAEITKLKEEADKIQIS